MIKEELVSMKSMKQILTFVLVAVTITLQTRSTTAHPVNSTSTTNVDSTACDNTYAYCCKQRPTSSPSIDDLYENLDGVIDTLKASCTNKTIRDNVRVVTHNKNMWCIYTIYSLL